MLTSTGRNVSLPVGPAAVPAGAHDPQQDEQEEHRRRQRHVLQADLDRMGTTIFNTIPKNLQECFPRDASSGIIKYEACKDELRRQIGGNPVLLDNYLQQAYLHLQF